MAFLYSPIMGLAAKLRHNAVPKGISDAYGRLNVDFEQTRSQPKELGRSSCNPSFGSVDRVLLLDRPLL
jgi:hypothetical protein